MIDKTQTLNNVESEATSGWVRNTVMENLSSAPADTLIKVMLQRRFLTYLFTPMCDFIASTLKSDEGVQIITDIVHDEYRVTNHRVDYVEELKLIGVDRDTIVRSTPSVETAKTMRNLIRVVKAVIKKPDLEQLAFIRYMGEVSTGHEFSQLFARLETLGLLTKRRSRFLWPHVRYDRLGGNDGALSHADRYLTLITSQLDDDTQWNGVRQVVAHAADIKHQFYRQFARSASDP